MRVIELHHLVCGRSPPVLNTSSTTNIVVPSDQMPRGFVLPAACRVLKSLLGSREPSERW